MRFIGIRSKASHDSINKDKHQDTSSLQYFYGMLKVKYIKLYLPTGHSQ